MKHLLIIAALACASCKVMPDGTKRYIGPNIGFSGGFNGFTMGITLYGDVGPVVPIVIPEPTRAPK